MSEVKLTNPGSKRVPLWLGVHHYHVPQCHHLYSDCASAELELRWPRGVAIPPGLLRIAMFSLWSSNAGLVPLSPLWAGAVPSSRFFGPPQPCFLLCSSSFLRLLTITPSQRGHRNFVALLVMMLSCEQDQAKLRFREVVIEALISTSIIFWALPSPVPFVFFYTF